MRRALVGGVGMIPFATPRKAEPYDVMAPSAVRAALADARIALDQVQQAYAGYVYGDSTSGQRALYKVGTTGIPIINVNNNCSTGSSALYLARQAVASGAADDPHCGISIVVVETDTPGFERGRNLDKVGQHAQDTAELFFTDARVPVVNLLDKEGRGFYALTNNLPQERLSLAVAAVASARAALDWTIEYVRQRRAFGQAIGEFQATRFRLADLVSEVEITQTYVDRAILELNAGTLSVVDAAKAKLWATELQGRVVDACLQLHGDTATCASSQSDARSPMLASPASTAVPVRS